MARAQIVVHSVNLIYRFLPGFREITLFEKKTSIFPFNFFGWALQRGGQGPGKGTNIYIMI